MALPNIVQSLTKLLTNNTPQVLTAMGAAGVIATAVLTGKASYRAAQILAEEPAHATTFEKAKVVWTLYIPPLSVAAVTVTAIILAERIGTRRAAAVVTAFTLSEKAFSEYRTKVVQKVGEKKEREFRDELAVERAERAGIPHNTFVVPGGMKQRCFDQYSERWFESTVDLLHRAENTINHNMIHNEACSLNEYYAEVGLNPVTYGEQVGWEAMDKLDLVITSFLPEDGIPAISVAFYTFPKPNYDNLH
jgi:hypothetical protein